MFLPCPHCGYLVALILPSQATRQHAASQRCPRCDGALLVEPPAASEPATTGGTTQPIGADPVTTAETDSTNTAPATVPDTPTSAPGATAPTAAAIAPGSVRDGASPPATPAGRKRRAPSFVRGNVAAARARLAWPWYATIVALGLLLALQLLLAQRHELAANARWRPLVAGVCSVLPCAVPTWHEPSAFTMLERNVQPSRTTTGALLVEASFRNDARWPQRWPTVLLSLSDVEGRQVGLRAFAPSEYRDGAGDAADELAPGQRATVRLQVREPAPRIVAFTFDFQ